MTAQQIHDGINIPVRRANAKRESTDILFRKIADKMPGANPVQRTEIVPRQGAAGPLYPGRDAIASPRASSGARRSAACLTPWSAGFEPGYVNVDWSGKAFTVGIAPDISNTDT
jgi:hypothetical protein